MLQEHSTSWDDTETDELDDEALEYPAMMGYESQGMTGPRR